MPPLSQEKHVIRRHPDRKEVWEDVENFGATIVTSCTPDLGRRLMTREEFERFNSLHGDRRADLRAAFGSRTARFNGLEVWVLSWNDKAVVVFSGKEQGTAYELWGKDFPGLAQEAKRTGAGAPPGWQGFLEQLEVQLRCAAEQKSEPQETGATPGM